MDVYGFYVMLTFVILETFLIRKSKKLYTDLLLEGENVDNFEVYKKTRSELSSRHNSNMSEKKFSVTIEDFEPQTEDLDCKIFGKFKIKIDNNFLKIKDNLLPSKTSSRKESDKNDVNELKAVS